MSTKITNALKVVVAVTMLATPVASPALAQSAPQQGAQDSGGTYRGYPLRDWHTQDSW
jgi:hypothetical protein